MKQSHTKPVVCFGEVLWDILPSGELPGGAPMNVTYHLNKLGSPASLITRIGHDQHGQRLVDLMSSTGINDGIRAGIDNTGILNTPGTNEFVSFISQQFSPIYFFELPGSFRYRIKQLEWDEIIF